MAHGEMCCQQLPSSRNSVLQAAAYSMQLQLAVLTSHGEDKLLEQGGLSGAAMLLGVQ